ncbi:VRR-NUC domain-containing protein [Candidatus Liberibacter sp.]|uniref:VRR-NUC domain-containing protein n=1 Tax=Candidatus Liberibacter sp. TaxID=34022 RepID=UPI0015F52534|nr:VRR-NUC domain-containing protein [Candidatus Liberibacter sp.]MBA5724409.1 VRR-NUC domain-containing protein [Candidatus Liberibacter sp.]
MNTERQIESRLVSGARKRGCFVRKIQFIAYRGCPDRIVITPKGAVHWVELKAPHGRLSKSQILTHEFLTYYAQNVSVLSSYEEVDAFLGGLQCN